MITVSPVESYEFGKHYGSKKGDFLSDGKSLSSSNVLNGVVRGFSDNIVFDNRIYPALEYPETPFGWVFAEDCLILSAGLAITVREVNSHSIVTGLFTGITGNVEWIADLIPAFPTSVVGQTQLMAGEQPIFVEKGTAIGFTPLGWNNPIYPGVEVSYYFTYMSDL